MKPFIMKTDDDTQVTILDAFDRVDENNETYRTYLIAYKDGSMDLAPENDILKYTFVRVI